MATATLRESIGSIPWRAPAVMLSSMVVALALAIGQHCFYASLNGKQVQGDEMRIAGWTTTPQQVNIVAGQAFVFLFKAALAIAASTAYMQIFFRTAGSTRYKLKKLDDLFSGPKDLLALLTVTTFYKHPVLFIMGTSVWLLPLAAVFSPTALTVKFGDILPSPTSSPVDTQPAFASLAFRDIRPLVRGGNGPSIDFDGASPDVVRIMDAAAAAGSILPIGSPGVNATWITTVEGPQLICNQIPAGDSFRVELKHNIQKTLNEFDFDLELMFGYLAWTNTTNNTLPFVLDVDQKLSLQGSSGTLYNNVNPLLEDLYIATFPRAANRSTSALWNETTEFTDELMDWYFDEAQVLWCQMQAASYSVRFTYNGTDQAQHLEILSTDTIPLKREEPQAFDVDLTQPNMSMITVGHENGPDGGITTLPTDPAGSLRRTAYHAVWKSFLRLILGATNLSSGSPGVASLVQQDRWNLSESNKTADQDYETKILTTSLRETRELQLLADSHVATTGDKDDYNSPNSQAWQQLLGIMPVPPRAVQYQKSLKDAIEGLYFNVSMSMASSASLQYQPNNPFAPPHIEVTYKLQGNIYSYMPVRLWLPYGLALGVALVDVLIGLWAIASIRASFTANFSTVFRIAKNTEVEVNTDEPHLPGRDPLPKELGEAVFMERNGETKQVRDQQYSSVNQVESES